MELGKFEILEELGRGGFGIVYKARDKALKRLVAIKVLHPNLVNDPTFVARFRQEAQIAAQLDHPNLVPVYEFGESEGRYYIVMGYMPGGSLKELIKKEGPLSKERALEILRQIGSGLAYAHSTGVIHRDLKPGNILFDAKGQARVSDMGFAKLLRSDSSASMSASGGLIGTPAYMAPEIWRGKGAASSADIYSVACILVEMLTGQPLFDGESTPEVMLKHFQPLILPENLPEEWKPVIERALEKEPENRFGSVDEFVYLLQASEEKLVQETATKQEEEPGPAGLQEVVTEDAEKSADKTETGQHSDYVNTSEDGLLPASDLSETPDAKDDRLEQEIEKEKASELAEPISEPEKPEPSKRKTPVYVGLGFFALFAMFFFFRSCGYFAPPEPTYEQEPPIGVSTATKKPDSAIQAPTSAKYSTSTPKPPSTPVKTATYANPYPDFETGICSINGVRDNCISKFTNTTTTFTAIFKSSILKSGTFILKINGVALDCKPYANLSGEFSCTGPRQNINTSLLLTISERQTNEELASAAIMLFVPTSKYGG